MPTFTANTSAEWIADFKKVYKRAPKILHVGNIANNAYQTAKMLNAQGADCDVLCADYYHVMGAPEWDDADFSGEIENQQCPNWSSVDLNGFIRPRWFAQAPRKTAIAYLMAKRSGKDSKAEKLWHKMEDQRKKLSQEKLPHSGISFIQNVKDKFLFAGEALAGMASNSNGNISYTKEYAHKIQEKLQKDAKDYFPDRKIIITAEMDYYIKTALEYKPLFEMYDIVQGYATEAIWPYLAGDTKYVAWEHGTLRTFPYEENTRGHLLLLSYAAADVVYVTNVDCYESAEYITKHSKAPIVCGLHGFDTERMLQKQKEAIAQQKDDISYIKDGEVLFFCPARIDIDSAYGTYLKSNDVLYRALDKVYAQHSATHPFKILQLEWGNDVDTFKDWLKKECPNLENAVIWHRPFSKKEFYRLLQHARLVFDNFLLPLMGGNGIETLMSGHAVLVNKAISQELMLRFFPAMWSVFSVENEEDIAKAAEEGLLNPQKCAETAKNGRDWIMNYHSHKAIVAKNCEAYEHLYDVCQKDGVNK